MSEKERIVPWRAYQEEAAQFFRSLDLVAKTDVTLKGVRTKHDIDVVVDLDVAGFEVRWLVECKFWKTRVTKLHILALREIVSDLGADRGIILCEKGFQSGAVEAANLTNVQVTSLAALTVSSSNAVHAARMRDLYDRTEICRERYWDIPKDVRIETGLRFEGYEDNLYSGARVIEACSELLARAFRGAYPIVTDRMYIIFNPTLPESFKDPSELVEAIEKLIADLEARLDDVMPLSLRN